MFWLIASTIVFAGMAVFMIFIRLKAAKKPASIKKIILPPIMMSTGAWMFIIPEFRVEWAQVFEAFILGIICSIFLIKTSKFEVKDSEVYLMPSRAFPFILFGLLIVRLVVKLIIGSYISFGETTGMFFLLALGMIVTWRIVMLFQFLKIRKTIA
jgi:membrane protein CcdC involved in cytochrome C biogenesis